MSAALRDGNDVVYLCLLYTSGWIQCEEMTHRMGFLSKHPTTQKPIPSPFINIGINYMSQAVRLWNEIFQIVKENYDFVLFQQIAAVSGRHAAVIRIGIIRG